MVARLLQPTPEQEDLLFGGFFAIEKVKYPHPGVLNILSSPLDKLRL
jgi:hypothetical protein